MIVYTTIIGGLFFAVLGAILVRPVSIALGATGELLDNCVLYGRISFISLMPFMLQNVFQSFFVTAEKPKLGLMVIVAAGLTNMVLDYVFIAVLGFGLKGAAIATVCGECVGGLLPLAYFGRHNKSPLKLGKTHFYGKVLIRTCSNGLSELMTNLSSSIVNSLYNLQLMKFAGENGVAAYGTIMYVNFIFVAIFIGYSIGSAPIISYHYGAQNHDELKNLFRKSLTLICIWAFALFVLAQFLAAPVSKLFVGYDRSLYEMTVMGFRIYCFGIPYKRLQHIWLIVLHRIKQRSNIRRNIISPNARIPVVSRTSAADDIRHKRYMVICRSRRTPDTVRHHNFLYKKEKILSLCVNSVRV